VHAECITVKQCAKCEFLHFPFLFYFSQHCFPTVALKCCRVSTYEYELDYVTGRSRAVTKQRQRGLVNIHELSPSHSSAVSLLVLWTHSWAAWAPVSSSAGSLWECVIKKTRTSQIKTLTPKCEEFAQQSHTLHGGFQHLKLLIEIIGLPACEILNPIQWINIGCIFMVCNSIDSVYQRGFWPPCFPFPDLMHENTDG